MLKIELCKITKSFCVFVCVGFAKIAYHIKKSIDKISLIFRRNINIGNHNHKNTIKGNFLFNLCGFFSQNNKKRVPFGIFIVTNLEVFC